MGVEPELEYTRRQARMAGRQPADRARLRADPLRSAGVPTLTIEEAIVRTLDWFDANPYAWEREVASGAGVR